jgi:hypothetical protein
VKFEDRFSTSVLRNKATFNKIVGLKTGEFSKVHEFGFSKAATIHPLLILFAHK